MSKTIKKLSFKPGTGLTIAYEGEFDEQGTPEVSSRTILADPSDNFKKSLQILGNSLVKATGLSSFEAALSGSASLRDKLEPADIKKALSFIAKRVEVSDVALRWSDGELLSVKVTGFHTNYAGDRLRISTPAIDTTANNYGWEAQLAKHVNTLVEEANAFLAGDYQTLAPELDEEEAPEEVEAEVEQEEEEDKPKGKKASRMMSVAA